MKDQSQIYDLSKEKIIITAEIGINHNGDLQIANEMIDAAASCGVDAVKFQAFNTPFMYSRLTPGFAHTQDDVFAQIQGYEIKPEWWCGLKERAKKNNLFFSASVFDQPSLDSLEPIGLDFVKVASGEITNLRFLQAQQSLSPVFVVSTGMAVLEEIAVAVRCLREKGIEKIILLECTSSYPAPPESVNLLNIDYLSQTFGTPAGFSDHTVGFHHSVAAAARGARFIEKHFTLDKHMDGPDHKLSSDPAEMKQLVRAVREIEISLKCNRKETVSPYENQAREIGRKSVVALEDIAGGEIISKTNTLLKRPGKGIAPSETEFLYGRKAKEDIKKDQWITWDMVSQ